MICPHCQSENREGAKFCDECGTKLVAAAPLSSSLSDSASATDVEAEEDTAASVTSSDAASFPEDPSFLEALVPPEIRELAAQKTNKIPVISDEIDDEGQSAPDLDSDDESPEASAEIEDEEQTTPGSDSEEELLEASEEGACVKDDELDECHDDAVGPDPDEDPDEDPDAPNLEPHDDPITDSVMRAPDVSESGEHDFSGIEFSGFKPAKPYIDNDVSDTKELPAIGTGIGGAKQTNFVAPSNDKEAKAAAKAQKKQAKLDKKAAKSSNKQEAGSSSGKSSYKRTALIAGAGCIAVAAVAGACVFGAYQLEMWGGKSVPDVVGMTQTDATYLLQNKGFAVRATQVSSDETEGLVLLADPGSGTREAEGSEVVIHVATARVVPSVVGEQRDAAVKALNDAGYDKVDIRTQKSDDVEGKVLSVEPAVGEKARSSQTVTLTVTEAYKVPDVQGTTWEDAKAKIENEGLQAYYTEEYNDNATAGTVLYTTPEIGSTVNSGSTVTVVVAKSRAYELTALARQLLPGMSLTLNDGSAYDIKSVQSVSYEGDDTCSFTVSGTVSKDVQLGSASTTATADSTETGSLTFGSDNSVVACRIYSS